MLKNLEKEHKSKDRYNFESWYAKFWCLPTILDTDTTELSPKMLAEYDKWLDDLDDINLEDGGN